MDGHRVSALKSLRLVSRALLFALLIFGAVVFLVRDPEKSNDGAIAWSVVIVVLAIVLRIVGGWLEPKLDASTDEALVATYNTRMFVRIALAEVPAAVGLIGSFVGPWWTYYVGLAVTLPALLRAMPSPRNIARDDEDLVLAGSSRRLETTLGSFYVRRG